MKSTLTPSAVLGLLTLLVTSGCTFFQAPPISANFLPGITASQNTPPQVSFSQPWDFDLGSESDYSFTSSQIEFAGGACRLRASDQIDHDATSMGFGGSSDANGISWDSSNSLFHLGASGGCNGTTTNCSELSSEWTPRWGNIVVYYRMNGTGTLAGGSPLIATIGSNGSVVDLGATGLTFQNGKSNEALRFTSAQYVTLPTSMPIVKYTKAVWTRIQSYGTANNLISGGAGSLQHYLYIPTDGHIRAGHFGAGELYDSYQVQTDTWIHVVLTYDSTVAGGTIKLYRDGELVQQASNFTASDDTSVQLGAFQGQYRLFGDLDEVAIWNVALNSNEVSHLYKRQSPAFAGSFTSRVMDAQSDGAEWTKLAWKTTLPFHKEIPGGPTENETSNDYSSLTGSLGNTTDNDTLTGLVGLWNLNETAAGSAPAGTDFADRSGNGNHGTIWGPVTPGATGKFGRAANPVGGSILVPDSPSLQFTTGLSVSMWAYRDSSSGWDVLIGKEFWNSGQGWVLYNEGASGRLTLYRAIGPTFISTANNVFPEKSWHHIAITNDNGDAKIYVDGNIVASGPVTLNNSPVALTIGSRHANDGGNPIDFFRGKIDEVAVWNRALASNEIQQLYRRGANRIAFQIRSCAMAACADDPAWMGPGGDPTTYFSELNNSTRTAPTLTVADYSATPSLNRYFQYRAILQSETSSASPELKSVTIDPVHYDSSGPAIIGTLGVRATSLGNFTETLGASCSSGIGYNLGVGTDSSIATWYWWDSSSNGGGGGWAVSNGTLAKTNSELALNSHLSTFPVIAPTDKIFVKARLKSTGTTPCALDRIDLDGVL